MGTLIARIISKIIAWAHYKTHMYKISKYSGISKKAKIGVNCIFNIPTDSLIIGDDTYLNQVHLSAGKNSKVLIGQGCAIGYNVSIKAITHSKTKPTNNKSGHIKHIEKNIVIGDNCWIGDNVFIREGVALGNNVIVGANSVVTRSFSSNVIIAGVPAKIISE